VVFLWAVAIGLASLVVLWEAPETNEVEDAYDTMLKNMGKSCMAQRRNQPDAFAYELEQDEAQGTSTATGESEEDWEFTDSKPPAKRRR
jgi:hypothetical protein